MGCGGSTPADNGGGGGGGGGGRGGASSEDVRSKQLELEMQQAQAEENKIIKLLVLGTGESGKSTVFKQMKILYSVPDPPSKYIMICRANLFGNAISVFDGMQKLGIKAGSPGAEEAITYLKSLPADGNIEPSTAQKSVDSLDLLRNDSGIKEAIERANEYQLNDSTIYFWDRASEICKADYLPTEQDVLRARVRTTGIVQQNFQIKDKKYTMFDVGGQRNERRKWIHCFDNVTAVIFVTAISEYDQVLYEDENTNRMTEAVQLFDQICNHPSFKKTSMILFLNKRDLFEIKLKKKDMTTWMPEAASCGQDYDKCIAFIKNEFQKKNKDPSGRQVYVHATCATDTENISFVMESVFDIILKENLRKLAVGDIEALINVSGGSGVSGVKTGPSIWDPDKMGKVLLAACWFTDTLASRQVLVGEGATACLPAVQIGNGLSISSEDFNWVQGLGSKMPKMLVTAAEAGTFRGDFKDAAEKLRGIVGSEDLGTLYDTAIEMTDKTGAKTILILCVKSLPSTTEVPGYTWAEHEQFEDACYKRFDAKDTDANPCKAPDKNAEFNPFAANPVGFRWFKGVTLFTKETSKIPEKGVYLGIFKVLSTSGGFQVMVNEHNRVAIPTIFLTESQLTGDDYTWMMGVRTREEAFGIDLLEGKKPNMGWLGPEMSGEEGATFPEKLWWAVDEAKSRLGGGQSQVDDIGLQYDHELLYVDENNNMQLLIFASLAKEITEILPGHIWVSKESLQVQNMKIFCPRVLQGMIGKQQKKIDEILAKSSSSSITKDEASKLRVEKDKAIVELKEMLKSQTPLKWIDRVIIWCADKFPSFTEGCKSGDANGRVKEALNSEKGKALTEMAKGREALIKEYIK